MGGERRDAEHLLEKIEQLKLVMIGHVGTLDQLQAAVSELEWLGKVALAASGNWADESVDRTPEDES